MQVMCYPSDVSSAPPPRILVVDDEPGVLTFLRTALVRRGYQVEAAAAPSQALEIAERAPSPDLVLCDVMMPEMCGPELVTKIVSSSPSIAVVLMSGAVPKPAALPQGADFISKPFVVKELFEIVERTLRRTRQAGAGQGQATTKGVV